MSAASGPTLRALQDLRRSIGIVSELGDAVILGGAGDVANAMPKLPEALRMLGRRVERALEALEEQS